MEQLCRLNATSGSARGAERAVSVFVYGMGYGKIGRSREAGGNLLAGGVFDEKGAGPEEGVEAPNTL